VGNSPGVVKGVRYWPGFFSSLKKAGFSVPDTMFENPPTAAGPDQRWLAKPALSGGGHGICFFDPEKERLYKNRRNRPGAPKSHSGTVFQKYIDGKPCSASFVANGRECVVLGIAEQLIGLKQFGAGHFRYCGNILPLPEMLHPDGGKILMEQIRRLAAFVTRTHGLIGLNGMDFILKDNEAYLTEVNPRYSASMELIEKSCGLGLFDMHARAVMYDELPAFHSEMICNYREFVGKAILFAERDVVVKDTAGWYSMGMRDIPASGESIRRGAPICTMLTGRATYNQTFAELTERARMLKEEIYEETEFNLDNRALHQAGSRHFDRKTGTRL
jgi:predicted ATP-grasp superfamily ATP-dependent carboligase